MIRSLLQTSTVQVALMVGLGGIALSVANLVYASVLPADDFGRLSLFQALLTLGVLLSPLGYEKLIARREVPGEGSIPWLARSVAFPAAVAVAGISGMLYGLPLLVSALLAIGGFFGAMSRLTASFDQALIRLKRAQAVHQLPFFVFLLGGGILLWVGKTDWRLAAGVLSFGYGIAALAGWVNLRRMRAEIASAWGNERRNNLRQLWPKAIAFLGINSATILLIQFERLLIPQMMSLADLAAFNVVAILVGSPYRILHSGFSYALLPRLRATKHAAERRRLVLQEIRLATLLGVVGGIVLVLGAAPVVRFLYAGKYEAPLALVIAIVFTGCLKILTGILAATVGAVGEHEMLSRFNLLGWAGNGFALACAVWASRFGLVGIVLGAATGWLIRIIAALVILRRQPEVNATPTNAGPVS